MARTITSANASLTLSIPGVFPVPQPIEGFSTDDAFDSENVVPTEAIMGVDGKLSTGYTPYPVKFKFVLQADSTSNDIMDQWRQAMDAAKESFEANMTLVSPAVGKVWSFIKGSLTGVMPTPQGKKVMQPQTYEITFNQVIAAPV